MLVDEYTLLAAPTESSSHPSLGVTVAPYSPPSLGAPPKQTFPEYLWFFLSLQGNFHEEAIFVKLAVATPG